MSIAQPFYINLQSLNITYTGVLMFEESVGSVDSKTVAPPDNSTTKEYDEKGAGIYVIAVVMVYGMSIVMLIASHIKRRHTKSIGR